MNTKVLFALFKAVKITPQDILQLLSQHSPFRVTAYLSKGRGIATITQTSKEWIVKVGNEPAVKFKKSDFAD